MTMPDREPLAAGRYDLLVVGGGIHGLFTAYDAARRGLRVALVERADFGGGLSFNHQRTLHGGLRAVERGRLAAARRQIHERRAWARIAPHLVRSLPFLTGTYRWSKRSRWAVKAGFAAYDYLGRHRNTGVVPELHLPKTKLESVAATRSLFPGIAASGLSGGAVWYDYQTRHPDRLTWCVALGAMAAGAVLRNYVEAIGSRRSNGRIAGARVRDVLSGEEYEIDAAATVLAPGSQLEPLMQRFGATGAPPLVRAMNVLIARPARDIALAARAASGRTLTAVPWRGSVLVGTYQDEQVAPPGDGGWSEGTLDAFLRDLNSAFPRFQVQRPDVRLVHHGLTPALVRGGRAEFLPDPRVVRHGNGAAGLVSIVGVKYTTARLVAERAVDAAAAAASHSRGRCTTGIAELPHAGIADAEGRLIETLRELGLRLEKDVQDHLTSWYGTESTEVARYAAASPFGVDCLGDDVPVLCAEMAYAVDHARAMRLSDAVLRRTPLGSAGHPGRGALDRAAAIMGEQLGWTDAQRADEIRAVESLYPG